MTGYWQVTVLALDDGSGEARITIVAGTGIRRPYVVIGEAWTVVGVVSQSESGYRLLPRRAEDLQRGRAAGTRTRTTTAASAPTADDMIWNRAPIYLLITGTTLTVRPPAPANLREAWQSGRVAAARSASRVRSAVVSPLGTATLRTAATKTVRFAGPSLR